MLNLQRESFRGEQISQFVEQANNHHASNVNLQRESLRRKFLFQDIIVFKGIEY